MSKNKLGLLFGVSAYSLWGAFPLYWPLLEPASPLEIVSHRAVWTLVFCFIVLAATKALKSTLVTLKRPTVAVKLFLSSLLISINWLVYIWATNNEHVVEASLGYYINPLIIIGFGVIFLKEKMRSLQWAAVQPHMKKRFSPADFLPDYAKPKRRRKNPEEQEAMLKQAFATMAKINHGQ